MILFLIIVKIFIYTLKNLYYNIYYIYYIYIYIQLLGKSSSSLLVQPSRNEQLSHGQQIDTIAPPLEEISRDHLRLRKARQDNISDVFHIFHNFHNFHNIYIYIYILMWLLLIITSFDGFHTSNIIVIITIIVYYCILLNLLS